MYRSERHFAGARRVAQALARIRRREWLRRQAFAGTPHSWGRKGRSNKDERADSVRAIAGAALRRDAWPYASASRWRSSPRRKLRVRPETAGKGRGRRRHGRVCEARPRERRGQTVAGPVRKLKSERYSRFKQYSWLHAAGNRFQLS